LKPGATTDRELRGALLRIWNAGLAAANPEQLVLSHLRRSGRNLRAAGGHFALGTGRLLVLAVGKAASRMAQAAERRLGAWIDGGLVVDVSAAVPLRRLRRIVAGHPHPDRRGSQAAREVERLLAGLRRGDLVVALLSGGASALLPAPAPGLRLRDKRRAAQLLMQAGAGIEELNCVRRHISRFKGGGLARGLGPARAVVLALSDVVGDDPATIAGGPFTPDPTTFADALAICRRLGVWARLPPAVREHLLAGRRGARSETGKAGEACFRRVRFRVIGSGLTSARAAVREARALGLQARLMDPRLTGEACVVGTTLGLQARRWAERARSRPAARVYAGETVVRVQGRGRGGRNQELAVAAAPALDGARRAVLVASLGTDGIDGRSPAAGGWVDRSSVARARQAGLRPVEQVLARNDSFGYLEALGDAHITGPTGTNVGDLIAVLVGK